MTAKLQRKQYANNFSALITVTGVGFIETLFSSMFHVYVPNILIITKSRFLYLTALFPSGD